MKATPSRKGLGSVGDVEEGVGQSEQVLGGKRAWGLGDWGLEEGAPEEGIPESVLLSFLSG